MTFAERAEISITALSTVEGRMRGNYGGAWFDVIPAKARIHDTERW